LRILLYNPDNGVTAISCRISGCFCPVLTPPGHEVLLIDGNANPWTGADRAVRPRREDRFSGIGAMTPHDRERLCSRRRIRATGVKVVMGRAARHRMADEALGRDGGPQHADAVALARPMKPGRQIVNDAARGKLRRSYAPWTRR